MKTAEDEAIDSTVIGLIETHNAFDKGTVQKFLTEGRKCFMEMKSLWKDGDDINVENFKSDEIHNLIAAYEQLLSLVHPDILEQELNTVQIQIIRDSLDIDIYTDPAAQREITLRIATYLNSLSRPRETSKIEEIRDDVRRQMQS